MKVNSDHKPNQFTESREKLFFNYNVVESEKTDEHGTRTVFDYDSIEVKSKEKKDIIIALIREQYSVDDEIALINNNIIAKDTILPEYNDYQVFRDNVKQIAEPLEITK
jgi:hypothetical protein